MNPNNDLRKYVAKHVERDAKGRLNLMFFRINKRGNPIEEDFLDLVKEQYPHWLDGKEHHYLECGGDMGDQGIALATMGLGAMLGVWKILTPDNMMPFLPKKLQMQMAGSGMISIIKEVKSW